MKQLIYIDHGEVDSYDTMTGIGIATDEKNAIRMINEYFGSDITLKDLDVIDGTNLSKVYIDDDVVFLNGYTLNEI